jgi:hypothetical protein
VTFGPFTTETELEARICADPEWQAGAVWGVPRPGHPEGPVKFHIADVLANVDRYATSPGDRQKLRRVALLHDTFKHRVDPGRPRVGENHHGTIARRFAERYIDDAIVLEITELHDEGYNAWQMGARRGRWPEAEERARRLLDRLGPDRVGLYVTFFRCDNETGTKRPDPWEWFARLARGPREDAS